MEKVYEYEEYIKWDESTPYRELTVYKSGNERPYLIEALSDWGNEYAEIPITEDELRKLYLALKDHFEGEANE